ncbi:J domain-containing protein [Roseivirga sp.]|uniref:J domain-containing protein n=1 Tax=Roseivirga sp. TaxID=1964215 RepID=UPI002B26FAB7|nr:J domain-containing protein [Roseivirga sp.]
MAKDYYQILGVTEGADQQEIKKAFRQKALELHPDVNPSSEAIAIFQEVKEAYEILGDEEARVHYDSGTVIINFEDFEEPAQRQYYQAEPQPVPTNFAIYAKQSTRLCALALVFSLTFFFDFFVQRDLGNVEVEYSEVSDYDPKNGGSYLMLVETKAGNFNAVSKGNSIYRGEILEMKKSYLYGFLKYKRFSESKFQFTRDNPLILFFMAGLVLLAGIFGVAPTTKPERKFNAAIVGCFFSFTLIISLLVI